MSRLPRPRRLILVLVAVMAVGLIQAGRGLIERSSASDLQTVTAMTLMEGPSGLTRLKPSEELVHDHPLI